MANFVDASNALRVPGQEYPIREEIQIEDFELSGDPMHFEGVRLEGVMVGAEERVNVRAEVSATLRSRCVRCLEDVEMPVEATMDAVFARQKDPDDPDLYGFEASTIELTDAVRDALILEIPIRILCSEDCKGLCPVCGVDRNKGTCTCREGGEVANPFEALKEFVHNDEEE